MLQRTINIFETFLYILASAGLLASIGLAFAAVVMRYGFDYSLEWIEEGARYLALFSALLVTGPVLRQRGHVALDLLTSNLRGTARQVHRLLVGAIALVVGAAVCAWGMRLVIQTYEYGMRTGSLQFPQWLPYSIVPLGMAVLVLFSLAEIVAAVEALRTGGPTPDGDETPAELGEGTGKG